MNKCARGICDYLKLLEIYAAPAVFQTVLGDGYSRPLMFALLSGYKIRICVLVDHLRGQAAIFVEYLVLSD